MPWDLSLSYSCTLSVPPLSLSSSPVTFAKPRHSQSLLMEGFTALSALSAASNASVRRNAHLLRLQDAMLMKWRSRPAFMQTDFHASMKSVHKNVRVNCIIKRRPTILHCRPSNLSQRIPRTALLRDCRFQCLFTGIVCIPSLSEVFSKLLSCVCPFLKSTPDCIDNLSYSLLCVNTQNFYPVVIIAPRFRSSSGTFLPIASFF